ncbi:D-alanine--D-alanine ligase [Streptomyces sp. NPDC096198]|uniref:D-alanine--D-alanine ligase family protein n=1 Tax=Streptomyces sp. NPDC096198 TaxID=3366080 RepID=UPI0038243499
MQIAPLGSGEFAEPVAVITGGWSQERDRSLLSGRTVQAALTGLGISNRVLDLDGSGADLVAELTGTELAFLAIAGRGAEDGRLQGLLETLGIPFTGSGVLASAVGMNKLHAKAVVATAGVRVPRATEVDTTVSVRNEAIRINATLGSVVMVKPVAEGGSIGLRVATTVENLATALNESGGRVMVEQFHAGRSVSVGVLEGAHGGVHVLPPLEATTPYGIYSYAAKRGKADCRYHCPAKLSEKTLCSLKRQAVAAHQALGCHSYSRHDFIVDGEGRAWWLEVNTLPGLSRSGNLARMAHAYGLTYEQLVLHILRGARVDRRAQV